MKTALQLVTDKPRYSYKYREVVALLPEHQRELLAKNRAALEEPARQLFNWVMKYGRTYLDATTLVVFQFIMWRTYTYFKRAELITKDQFLFGVQDSKTNEPHCAAATPSAHTLYRSLNILESLGFIDWYTIQINGADVSSLFEINFKNVLSHDLQGDEMHKLRVSKKKSAEIIDFPSDNDSLLRVGRRCKVAPPPVVQGCTTEYYNKKKDTKDSSCSVPRNAKRSRIRKVEIDCNDTAETSIGKAIARVTELREAKVRRAAGPRAGFIALTDLNATWQSSMIAAFGKCTVSGLTHKEYGMLKRIAKTHTMACTWKEFCEWTINNWSAINRESKEIAAYKKKKTGDWSLQDSEKIFLGSDTPDIFMMVRNFAKLIKRYAQQSLSGRSVKAEDSAEVVELRRQAQEARREANINKQLLQKALSAKTSSVPTPTRQRSVKIVNPIKDTFFEDADSSLPEWK